VTAPARRTSAKTARAVIEAAELVKAPTWSDTRAWHVTSGDQTLVIVEPSYGGTSRTGRNGWTWRPPGGGPHRRPARTREEAAAQGLAAWQRQVTTKPQP